MSEQRTLYRPTKTDMYVIKKPHGRYRFKEFLKAAIDQGFLEAAEATDRICVVHGAWHKDLNAVCFLRAETGSSVECRWVDVVRISTTNPMATESELVVETRESDEEIRDRVEGERLMNSDRQENQHE